MTKVGKTDGFEFFLYFAQSRVYWVFLGTKMQKTEILQNLLDFSGILMWWQLWPCLKDPSLVVFVYKIDTSQFCLKYVPWIFLKFYMIPLIWKLVKVIFFFSRKFLLLSKLEHFCQSRLYTNFLWENVRKNVCQFFLFSNEHITLDRTLLYNEINLSFLSAN